MAEQRYGIAGDDSGHTVAIPIERMADWWDWIDEEGWDNDEPNPDYAIIVDGNFTFTDPQPNIKAGL